MEKFSEKFKNFFSSDEALKRVPKYLFTLCILFVAILVTLVKINNNLEIIADNKSNIEIITNNDEINSEIEVNEEKESQLGDYLPYFDEPTENATDNSNKLAEDNINESNTENSVSDTSAKITYVINTTSNKIHFSDCSFANRMKEENKKVVKLSKAELNDYLNNGYTFCKTCGGN